MDIEFLLKVLASGRRRQIIGWLKNPREHFPPQRDGDLVKDGVCGLLVARKLRVSQPTASDHLNLLVRAGLLKSKRIKQWTFYRRNEVAIMAFKRALVAKL